MNDTVTTGVRINGGKVHVWRPVLRPVTRCGVPKRALDEAVEVEVSGDTPPASERCRNCFPGTGRDT